MLHASTPEESRDKLAPAGAMGSCQDEDGGRGGWPAAGQGCPKSTGTGQGDSIETVCRKCTFIFNLLLKYLTALPEFLKERKVRGEDSKPVEQAQT